MANTQQSRPGLTDDETRLLGTLPASYRNNVMEWTGRIRIAAGMIDAVLEGHMEIVGFDGGEPEFRLTEAGTRFVEDTLLAADPGKGDTVSTR